MFRFNLATMLFSKLSIDGLETNNIYNLCNYNKGCWLVLTYVYLLI